MSNQFFIFRFFTIGILVRVFDFFDYVYCISFFCNFVVFCVDYFIYCFYTITCATQSDYKDSVVSKWKNVFLFVFLGQIGDTMKLHAVQKHQLETARKFLAKLLGKQENVMHQMMGYNEYGLWVGSQSDSKSTSQTKSDSKSTTKIQGRTSTPTILLKGFF